jgi:hypothetical protein
MKIIISIVLTLTLFSCISIQVEREDKIEKYILVFDISKSNDSTHIILKDKIESKEMGKLIQRLKKKNRLLPNSIEIIAKSYDDTLQFFEENPLEKYFEYSDEEGNFHRKKSILKEAELIIEIPAIYNEIEFSRIDSIKQKHFLKKLKVK